MSKGTIKDILIAFVFYSIVVSAVFYKIVKDPKQFLVTSGDGMKNYYTFMYHIRYDTSYMTFEGMNYPYGENIVFTDNQPIIANAVKLLSNFIPELYCQLPIIHNLLLLLGLVFGGLGIFLCFRRLKVEFYFALVCGAGLMLLNPQLNRISAHFSMFYPILPWLFLIWFDYFQNKNQLRSSFLIATIITVSGLVHMYFFITGAILVILSLLAYYLINYKNTKVLNIIKSIIIQVFLPFLILTFFSSYFNHATDRPNEPWGFFSYHSYWEGLLFSYKLPLFEFVNDNIVTVRSVEFEGKNYVGLFGVFAILYAVFLLIFNFRKSISYLKNNNIDVFLIFVFITSALISFGYPFTISGLEWLLDYTGPFKQFRSIGRVGWVSFYAINFIAIPMIYRKIIVLQNSKILYFAIPCILFIEGLLFAKQTVLYQSPLEVYYCNDTNNIPIDFSKYQATLPDPYFHIGSESFSWWDQAENVNQAFQLGYKYHLPTMGVNMSRTSFHQAKMLNELIIQPYKVPEIVQYLKEKSEKPLLVVESKLQINDHRASLKHWTKNAPIVYENDQFILRSLSLNSFEETVKAYNDSLKIVSSFVPAHNFKLDFDKIEGQKGWGYEAYIISDSLAAGSYTFEYWMTCPDPTYVLSTSEIWQFDQNHNMLDYVGEGNRFNYKMATETEYLFTAKINIKENTKKVVFKISKFNQKGKHNLNIRQAILKSDF